MNAIDWWGTHFRFANHTALDANVFSHESLYRSGEGEVEATVEMDMSPDAAVYLLVGAKQQVDWDYSLAQDDSEWNLTGTVPIRSR